MKKFNLNIKKINNIIINNIKDKYLIDSKIVQINDLNKFT